ncbi:MAG: MATE family efflux transporter [Clostridia bacterium]|nr:MATE family efflux transporter [Clostridia bacterium]
MDDKNQRLATESIPKLIISLAIPSIIAQLVTMLYNMADRIYIGHTTNGTTAMAALGITLPIITLINAFTMLFGMGGAPLCAISLGEKNQKKAEKIMANSFICLIASSIIITLAVLLFKEPVLYLFGADSLTIEPAKSYISIYVLGTIFIQLTIGMNAYINTQGYTQIGMRTTLLGAVLNIILDPVFIYGFNMGITGAAIATVLSQCTSCIWVLKFLTSEKSTVKLRKIYFKPDFKIILSICSLGISTFIMSSTESLLQISFNNRLSIYGGTTAVGIMSIMNTFLQCISLPTQGIMIGTQPVLSYNYGAKNYKRVRDGFKFAIKLTTGATLIIGWSLILFSDIFVKIFTTDPVYIEFSRWSIKVFLLGMTIFGLQICCQQSFMALGQAKISLCMALLRKVILLIPLIYILPVVFGDFQFAAAMSEPIAKFVSDAPRVFLVLLAEPLSDIIACLTTTTLFIRFYKKHLYN